MAAGATESPHLKGDITVFAATSLTDAFKEAGKAFETAHPGVHVALNFAASSALATQIDQGQPGDVFASADSANMKKLTDKNLAGSPAIFVTNVPVVVVPASGSPVKSFEDLAKPGVKLVLAAPAVPIGNYARAILTNASAATGGISEGFSDKALANLKSNEADVRAVLVKIQTGEADAGIVYTTDAAVGGSQVKTIAVPEKYNVIAQYPIATLTGSGHANVAAAFVSFITSEAGQAIMKKYGFGQAPSAPAALSTSLSVTGLVDRPVTLTAEMVKAAPQLSVKGTDKDGVEQSYTGMALATVLKNAGIQPAAANVVFTGADGYVQTVSVQTLNADPNAVIIVDPNGTLRNIVPSQASRTWVRVLVKIEVK